MSRTDKPKQCSFCDKLTHTGGFLEDNNCDYCGKDLDTVTFEGVEYNLSVPEEETAWYKATQDSVLGVLKMTKCRHPLSTVLSKDNGKTFICGKCGENVPLLEFLKSKQN